MNIVLLLTFFGSLLVILCRCIESDEVRFERIPKIFNDVQHLPYEIIVLNPEDAVDSIDPTWEDIMNNVGGFGSNTTDSTSRDEPSSTRLPSIWEYCSLFGSLLLGIVIFEF